MSQSSWPFGDLIPLSYDIILVDLPLRFRLWSEAGRGRSAERHYPTLSDEEIRALPVADLASRDCLLWLWATWSKLPDVLGFMEAWGFVYKSGGAWVKTTKSGGDAMGPGYIIRNSSEPYLLGTIGRPKTADDVRCTVRSQELLQIADDGHRPSADELVQLLDDTIEARRREHSRKPDEAFQMIDRWAPRALRKAELFSRERREGWDAWGNEVDKFGGQP